MNPKFIASYKPTMYICDNFSFYFFIYICEPNEELSICFNVLALGHDPIILCYNINHFIYFLNLEKVS